MLAVANQFAGKPGYKTAGDWAGGASGDEREATATVALANSHSANVEPDYSPRTHADKATLIGQNLVTDVARPRGWIEPKQPYTTAGGPPVVASLSPNTGAAAALPMQVTITGTGFTPWSTVFVGGQKTADVSGKYVSATQMKVALFAAAPGTVSVMVKDHDLSSNTNVVFTVT
jgi:hypothetical protein